MRSIYRLLCASRNRAPDAIAVSARGEHIDYRTLLSRVNAFGTGLATLISPTERVAMYVDKSPELVVSLFATAGIGGVAVPINPQLKPQQVGHILRDSGARVLITTSARARALAGQLPAQLQLVLCSQPGEQPHDARTFAGLSVVEAPIVDRSIDSDAAAILYTSGSTGLPKGVVLSHRNLVAGAQAVNEYLGITENDVILGVLPFSFDAGLSQLTTAVAAGARIVLLNYLLPREVPATCAAEAVTVITAVPPLWFEIASARWSDEARLRLRRFANTGGHMPGPLLAQLRQLFARAQPFLMYGLTEAFRSTYLDPSEVDRRPGSMGKAIPNAEILIVRPDGTPCAADEPGELVHRGACVTLGYWNDPEGTRQRFRPLENPLNRALLPQLAVWSGDIVRRDAEGFLYFIGRADDLIKSSGYRISPTEVEGVIYASGQVDEVSVIGVAHPQLGQAIVAMIVTRAGQAPDAGALLAHCRSRLPSYMVPARFIAVASLPRNANGKIDRKALAAQLSATAPQAAEVSA